MSTKIVAISDQHGHLPEIPECDILLIAGDICPANNHTLRYQADWLDGEFRGWLNRIPAKNVVGVAGNHDFLFMHDPDLIRGLKLRWNYLDCETVQIGDLKIWGSPWQNWFYDWAFNAPKIDGEEFLEKIYAMMPDDTDIVVSHGPPFGGRAIAKEITHGEIFGNYDYTLGYQGSPRMHVGSKALSKRLDQVMPTLTVCGHIHSGRLGGRVHVQWMAEPDYSGFAPGIIANVSVVNEKYSMVYEPSEFTIDDGGVY